LDRYWTHRWTHAGRDYKRGANGTSEEIFNKAFHIYADTVIFGAAAISFMRGVMVHDPDAQRELLQSGKRRVLVVESSKIGTEATYRLGGIEDCDLIQTDKRVSAEDLARLRQMTQAQVAE
jgi:DeoR family fructose operon transcriptional repressor